MILRRCTTPSKFDVQVMECSTVESLMNALEAKLDPELSESSEARREREMSAELDSMFKTKVNWEHCVGPFKKMQRQHDELNEATFYKVLEQYADSKLMRASRR